MVKVKTDNYPDKERNSTTTIGRKFKVEYTTSYPEDYASVRVSVNGHGGFIVGGTIETIWNYYKGVVDGIRTTKEN